MEWLRLEHGHQCTWIVFANALCATVYYKLSILHWLKTNQSSPTDQCWNSAKSLLVTLNQPLAFICFPVPTAHLQSVEHHIPKANAVLFPGSPRMTQTNPVNLLCKADATDQWLPERMDTRVLRGVTDTVQDTDIHQTDHRMYVVFSFFSLVFLFSLSFSPIQPPLFSSLSSGSFEASFQSESCVCSPFPSLFSISHYHLNSMCSSLAISFICDRKFQILWTI